jgi:hypothetical protein
MTLQSELLLSRKQTTTNAGRDAWKKEPSSTVHGNVK